MSDASQMFHGGIKTGDIVAGLLAFCGSRRCCVGLHMPDVSLLFVSMGVRYLKSSDSAQIDQQLPIAFAQPDPKVMGIDMKARGQSTKSLRYCKESSKP